MKKNIILVIIGILSIFMVSCDSMNWVEGNGDNSVQMRDDADIHAVIVEGSMNVYLTHAPHDSIKVIAESNLLALILTTVENGILTVRFKNNSNIRENYPIEIYVSSLQFDKIKVTGSGLIECDSLTSVSDVELIVTGSGDIFCKGINAYTASSEVLGSGNISFNSCVAEFLDIDISGSGEVNGLSTEVSNVSLLINGSGNINLDLQSTNISSKINSSGDISLKGQAIKESININGSGDYNSYNCCSNCLIIHSGQIFSTPKVLNLKNQIN